MEIWQEFESLLGIGKDPKDLTFLEISLRGTLMFVAAIVMVRLGEKRFFSGKTAFDAVLGFILASTLARGINGSAPYFETIGAGFVLVFLHRAFAALAYRTDFFGRFIKGNSDVLVKDGVVLRERMRHHNISERDLMEDLRLQGKVTDVGQVKLATFERNGIISVVEKKDGEPGGG